jgi:ribulose-5-phosphate 4-epimerase/fuculose-1-phosphate aldolase
MDVAVLQRSVAQACRVLASQGLAADVLGHVSVRVSPTAVPVRCRGPRESGPA